MAILLLQEKF